MSNDKNLIDYLSNYYRKINNKSELYSDIVIDKNFEYCGLDFNKTRLILTLDKVDYNYIIENFINSFCKILLDNLSKGDYVDKYVIIKEFNFYSRHNPSNHTFDNNLICEIYSIKKPINVTFKLQ